jgi:uncharacterized protein with PQ loop repeat
MNSANKKLILEFYGLAKMFLGLAQLIGLGSGYFLLEWIVRYPTQFFLYVFNQDLLALIYVAVVVRAIIHFITGIGIVRLRNWGKLWLVFGWPIVIIITAGLTLNLYSVWRDQGYGISLAEVIAWPKLIAYLGIIIFDYGFVRSWMNDLSQGEEIEGSGGRLELHKVFLSVFAMIVLIGILLFMGRTTKEGFHQGFYKKGPASTTEEGGQEVQKLESKIDLSKKSEEAAKPIPKGEKPSPEDLLNNPVAKTIVVKEDANGAETAPRVISSERGEEGKKDLPYRNFLGILAGLCALVGLFFQLNEIYQVKDGHNVSLGCFVFLSIACVLLLIYSVTIDVILLTFVAFLSLLASLAIIALKFKYDS